ncbi:Hypothetical predicted protein [Lecanosticta acicola]|uniref:Uncharacterized protein n=1 Tax=Lecanosticta acicola TaxID=111012 RepID=A0AAI9ECF2_9PEZI|nr:Hypothetical predicted protein [Lecanosticta acicola]
MGSDLEFTAREREIMAVAWHCFEGEPKMNYQKLAELMEMTNVGSAYNAWNRIRHKLIGKDIGSQSSGKKRKAAGASKRTSTKRIKVEKSYSQSKEDKALQSDQDVFKEEEEAAATVAKVESE